MSQVKRQAVQYDYELYSEFGGTTFYWWLKATDERDVDTDFEYGFCSKGGATRAGIAYCKRRLIGRVKLPNGTVREFNI